MKEQKEQKIEFTSPFNWGEIKKAATHYEWAVMYRDHYRGNSCGEIFHASDFERLYEEQPFWFHNVDRPVYRVVLTNEDVEGIIAHRTFLWRRIYKLQSSLSRVNVPTRPECDGRATRRTQPEAFAKWDVDRKAAQEKRNELNEDIDINLEELYTLPPYSTSLYFIKH